MWERRTVEETRTWQSLPIMEMGSFVGAAGMLWSDSTEITVSGEGDYRKLRYVQERNTLTLASEAMK